MTRNKIQAIELILVDAATITTSYTSLNVAGIPEACVMISISNDSDQAITLSYNGFTDQEYIRSKSDKTLSFQTNSAPTSNVSMLPKGTQFFVKNSATATGTIAISGYYL